MADVIVLGAGPAGLLAAHDLAAAGHRVTLLEAQDRTGGMAASIDVGGQRVDLGSHRLHHATPPDLLAEIRSWLGVDLQIRERNGRIHLGGRWVGFPLRAGDMARHLPPTFTLRAVRDTLLAPLRRGEVDSFDDAIRRRFGPAVADDFYAPYARKLYGVHPAELSVELAERRVSAGGPVDILRRVLKAAKPEGRTFLYPRGGYGQITDHLTDRMVEAGVDLRLRSPVTAVEPRPDRVTVHSPGQVLDADLVLSSLAPQTLARLLPNVPDDVRQALGRIHTRAMVLVYLVLDQDRYTPFDAHYVPDLATTTARLSEPKNYRTGDDAAGRTVLCAELPCWAGDDIWTATDAELGDLVTADLARLGLPEPRVVEVASERLPSVYPVLDRGGAAARRTVADWVSDIDRVVSFGRQGLSVPDNLHHVFAMGRDAAAAVEADGSFDRQRWRAALERFAQHVVED